MGFLWFCMKELERVLLFILQSVRQGVLHRYLDTSKYKLLRSELIQTESSPSFWQFNLKTCQNILEIKCLFLRKKAQISVSYTKVCILRFCFPVLDGRYPGECKQQNCFCISQLDFHCTHWLPAHHFLVESSFHSFDLCWVFLADHTVTLWNIVWHDQEKQLTVNILFVLQTYM